MREVYGPPRLGTGTDHYKYIYGCIEDMFQHALANDPALADWLYENADKFRGNWARGQEAVPDLVNKRRWQLFRYHVVDEKGNLNNWLRVEPGSESRIAAKLASDIGASSDGAAIELGGKRVTVKINNKDGTLGLFEPNGRQYSGHLFDYPYDNVLKTLKIYFGMEDRRR